VSDHPLTTRICVRAIAINSLPNRDHRGATFPTGSTAAISGCAFGNSTGHRDTIVMSDGSTVNLSDCNVPWVQLGLADPEPDTSRVRTPQLS